MPLSTTIEKFAARFQPKIQAPVGALAAEGLPGMKRNNRSMFSLENKGEGFVEKMLKEYGSLTYALTDRLGCLPPPQDPYLLLILADASGYHANAMRWRKVGSTGLGYTGSDRLMQHLRMANEKETFQKFLNSWSDDAEHFGNAYTHIVKSPVTVNFYRRPAVRMRIKPPNPDGPMKYIYYQYVAGSGQAAYLAYDPFIPGASEGISQFALHSRSGNDYYGEVDYTSNLKLLSLNVGIIDLAQTYFDNSMIVNMAMIYKGELDPEEKENVRTYLQQNMKGASNAYKVLFLEIENTDDVKLEKFSEQFNEALFIKMRDSIREETAASDGVPPRMAGILNGNSLGGSGEAAAQLFSFKIGWATSRQNEIRDYWRNLLREAGLPDPDTFDVNELDISSIAPVAAAPTPPIPEPAQKAQQLEEEDKAITWFLRGINALKNKLQYDGEASED